MWSWRFSLPVILLALVIGLTGGVAIAGDDGAWSTETKRAPAISRYEAWAGADATATGGWSAYGGMTSALFGDIRQDGLRIRSSGGYGQYRYTRPYFDPFTRRMTWPEFRGQMSYTDVLLGYQASLGPTTLKLYAGYASETHDVRAGAGSAITVDDENAVQGGQQGAKVVVETWTRLADWGFLQADASWSQPFAAYSGRVRLGYRLNPAWSTGLEAAAFGNVNHDQLRAGAFVRFEWTGGEISASAGLDGEARDFYGAYASANAMLRF